MVFSELARRGAAALRTRCGFFALGAHRPPTPGARAYDKEALIARHYVNALQGLRPVVSTPTGRRAKEGGAPRKRRTARRTGERPERVCRRPARAIEDEEVLRYRVTAQNSSQPS